MDILPVANTESYAQVERVIERGVGFILDQDMKKWFLGYYQLFARILTFKLKGKHFNITIIVYMHQ